MALSRRGLLAVTFSVLFLFLTRVLYRHTGQLQTYFLPKKPVTKHPLILFWRMPQFLEESMREKYGSVPYYEDLGEKCGGCVLTNDKTALEQSNVIVLHDNFAGKKGDVPPIRLPHQLYVFYTKENPFHTKFLVRSNYGLQHYDTMFNITMTYRHDSDVIMRYGCWEKNLLQFENINLYNKKKLALMLASDCFRVGGKLRKIYSDRLVKAGLKLDRYGKCFKHRYEGGLPPLISNYKFFMAFENTLNCREYITEKFWRNSLKLGSVPVVWGTAKKDVLRVAPPHSFIHVEDFESARHLAEYLMYLDKNDTAYLEYFKWRNLPPPKDDLLSGCGKIPGEKWESMPGAFCVLCQKVSHGFQGRVNISKWWYGTENPECLRRDFKGLAQFQKDNYGVQ